MIRRIHLLGALLAAGLLMLLGGTALAAAKKSKSAPVTRVVCTTKTSTAVPAGQTAVSPPEQQGADYGTATCAKLLGRGVEADTFTVPSSGDTMAKYWMYFGTGAIHGTYDLTPSDTGSLNFLQTSWTGTMKIVGGTGAYKGAKGTGTMTCQTADGVHTTCTDKLKLTKI